MGIRSNTKLVILKMSIKNDFNEYLTGFKLYGDDFSKDEIKEYDRRIKEARRFALAALTLEEKLAAQKEVKALEKERSDKRRSLFLAQDEIDAQRDKIISDTEARLEYKESLDELFCVRWSIV